MFDFRTAGGKNYPEASISLVILQACKNLKLANPFGFVILKTDAGANVSAQRQPAEEKEGIL